MLSFFAFPSSFVYHLVIGCRSFVKSNTSLLFPQLLSCICEKNAIYMCHQSNHLNCFLGIVKNILFFIREEDELFRVI